ncbi:MAG TPA: hypothetical protein PKU97_20405, partial [Kofleriaceae bacterium]|nr:hypothetical protein [Kofleriaceae bacterium]
ERVALEAQSDPFALAFEAAAPTIEARLLRGSRWVPAQLAQLSLDSAQLAAVSVPRVGDRVYVALSFADAVVTVGGTVSYASEELEAQHSGVAMFQVQLQQEESDRARLSAMLRRAR